MTAYVALLRAVNVGGSNRVPMTELRATLDPDRSPPAAFAVDGREVYLSYPDGSGRSRLTLDYLERHLGVTGTARNWRTVQRLAGLLDRMELESR